MGMHAPVVVGGSSLWSPRLRRSPLDRTRSSYKQGERCECCGRSAYTGTSGAQQSTGSPVRERRDAIPVFMTDNVDHGAAPTATTGRKPDALPHRS
ncbi:hypothetical protein GCM10023205_31920 [Yinghuangia aomiensis]|uniref:Uncharacterized protein n=1 Tax=Yinghuangia aomiensis TaxID=676205 RepID=A0ABP9HA32_9ACTN